METKHFSEDAPMLSPCFLLISLFLYTRLFLQFQVLTLFNLVLLPPSIVPSSIDVNNPLPLNICPRQFPFLLEIVTSMLFFPYTYLIFHHLISFPYILHFPLFSKSAFCTCFLSFSSTTKRVYEYIVQKKKSL